MVSVGKRSKEKGKRYERRIAALLTEFTGVGFRKIPGSGGYNKTGGVIVAEHKFCGDIICDREDLRYFIEAKFRETYSHTAIVKSIYTCQFTQWWGKTCYEADGLDLIPMIFFKPGTTDDFMGITSLQAQALEIVPKISIQFPPGPYEIIMSEKGKNKEIITMDSIPDCAWFDWKEFITVADPKELFERWDADVGKNVPSE